MELDLIKIVSEIGLPGFVVVAVALGFKVLWDFFKSTYWPHLVKRQEVEDARRDRQAERESDQWTWMVQEMSSVTANLQRVVDGQKRLEHACWEMKFQSIFETQPLPEPEKVREAISKSEN